MADEVLFGTLEYSGKSELQEFMENMTPDKSVVILVAAAAKAQGKNIYTPEESAVITKAIKTLTINPKFIP